MKGAIVIAGGDSTRRRQLIGNLGSEQYKTLICQSLTDFSKATIEQDRINAILLLYPDESGIIHERFHSEMIRSVIGNAPIVFISSSSAENRRVRSLRYKAVEFLIEPISSREIEKIINVIGSPFQNYDRRILAIGDLVLDRTSMIVTLRNVELPLFPIQARILEFLMISPGRVFTRQEILSNIWSADSSIDDRTIDVSIGRVRDALRHKVIVDPIRTVRSVGYAFNENFGQTTSLPKRRRIMKRAQ